MSGQKEVPGEDRAREEDLRKALIEYNTWCDRFEWATDATDINIAIEGMRLANEKLRIAREALTLEQEVDTLISWMRERLVGDREGGQG